MVVSLGLVLADGPLDRDFPRDNLPVYLAAYLAGGVFGFLILRMRVAAGPDSLVVRNIGKTHVLRWNEIAGFTVETSLRIELLDGRRVGCLSVQPTNLARMLGRKSYAEQVVDELEALRTRYSSASQES